MAGFVYGVRLLPLTTAYAISFVEPLLVTAMEVPILGEKVGPRRWAAIFVGLIGVLVVLRPTGQGMMTLGGPATLGAASCSAASAVTVGVRAKRHCPRARVVWLAVMAVGRSCGWE